MEGPHLNHMQSGPQRWPFNDSLLTLKGQESSFPVGLLLIIASVRRKSSYPHHSGMLFQLGLRVIFTTFGSFLWGATVAQPTSHEWNFIFHSGTRLGGHPKSLSRTHQPKRNNSWLWLKGRTGVSKNAWECKEQPKGLYPPYSITTNSLATGREVFVGAVKGL